MNVRNTPVFLPYLNCWALFLIISTTAFLKQSHEETMCAGLGGTGTQTLSERLLAAFRPLRKQRDQPAGGHKHFQGIVALKLNY